MTSRNICIAGFVVLVIALVGVFLCLHTADSGETIRDGANCFKLELPAGYYVRPDLIQRMREVEAAAPEVFPVIHMIAASPNGSTSTMPQIAIRAWDNTLAQDQLDRKIGAGVSGTSTARWKNHDLKGWYSDGGPNGVTVVSTVVPLKPRAIQLDVGVVTGAAAGMRLLDTLLEKLDGETNWDIATTDSVSTK